MRRDNRKALLVVSLTYVRLMTSVQTFAFTFYV